MSTATIGPPPWKPWFDATLGAAPHCFMQLASLARDGARCRTLTLRERHGQALWFTTDQRSEKAMQLEQAPRTEACWYDLESRTQWRFRGTVHLLTPDQHPEECQRLWQRIGDADRRRFHGPPPGSIWRPGGERSPDLDAPAESFAILALTVDHVQVLELMDEPHRHWHYHGEGRAAPTRLVP